VRQLQDFFDLLGRVTSREALGKRYGELSADYNLFYTFEKEVELWYTGRSYGSNRILKEPHCYEFYKM